MARPKSFITEELAERALADLKALDRDRVAQKLRAIASAAAIPVAHVAMVLGVAVETVWRWAKAYADGGVEGLSLRPGRGRPPKLSPEQRGTVLGWIDGARAPGGGCAHWTLEKLRQAVADEFGADLSLNALWAWMRREGRGLVVPRPRHRKADAAAQEAFKKNGRGSERRPRPPRAFL
jgi:transposase